MDLPSLQLAHRIFPPIPRRSEIPRRSLILALGGRFADELLSGLFDVLLPTFRAVFGLSYVEAALLGQSLVYVALLVEPLNGLLIDLVRRQWLMAWGAGALGVAMLLMGLAPDFVLLLLGFMAYGLGSGPLAHTADVVLVEAHPGAPERIIARATVIDTLGALLAPLLVGVVLLLDFSWREPLLGGAAFGLLYALFLLRARLPAPPRAGENRASAALWQELRQNISTVLRNRQMWQWLLFLFAYDLFEAPFTLRTVWLAEHAGMSQTMVGFYRALEMTISFLSLLWLDHWLRRLPGRRILWLAVGGLLFIVPAWLLVPGLAPRFLLALPLNFLQAVIWPISLGQLLATVPGKAGTVTALGSLFAALPLAFLFGWFAEATSLTSATLTVHVGSLLLLALMLWSMPGGSRQ